MRRLFRRLKNEQGNSTPNKNNTEEGVNESNEVLNISGESGSTGESSFQAGEDNHSESSSAASPAGAKTPSGSKIPSRPSSEISLSRSESQTSGSIISSYSATKTPSKAKSVSKIFRKALSVGMLGNELNLLANPILEVYELLRNSVSSRDLSVRHGALRKASSALSQNAEDINHLLADFQMPEKTDTDLSACQLVIDILKAISAELKQLEENEEKERLKRRHYILSLFVIEKFRFSKSQEKLILNLNNIFNGFMSGPIFISPSGFVFPSTKEVVEQFKIFFTLLEIGQIREDSVVIPHKQIKDFLEILGYPEKTLDAAIAYLYKNYLAGEISGERKYQYWACFDEEFLRNPLALENYFAFLMAEAKRTERRGRLDSELKQTLAKMPKPEFIDSQSLNEKCYQLFVWLERIRLASGEVSKKFLTFSTFLFQKEPYYISLVNALLTAHGIAEKKGEIFIASLSDVEIENLINSLFSDFCWLFFPTTELRHVPVSLNRIGLNISIEYEIAQELMKILSFRGISSSYLQNKMIISHHAIRELFYLAHFPHDITLHIIDAWYQNNGLEFRLEERESTIMASLFENLSLPFYPFVLNREGLEIYINNCFDAFEKVLSENNVEASYYSESALIPHHYTEKFFRLGHQHPSCLDNMYERRCINFDDEIFKSILNSSRDEESIDKSGLHVSAIPYDNETSYIIQLKLDLKDDFNEPKVLIGLAAPAVRLTRRFFLNEQQRVIYTHFVVPRVTLISEIVVLWQVGEKFNLHTFSVKEALFISEVERNSIWMRFFEEQFATMNTFNGEDKMEFGIKLKMRIGDKNDPFTKLIRRKIDTLLDETKIESNFSQVFLSENIYSILNEVLLKKLPYINSKARTQVTSGLSDFDPSSLIYYMYFDSFTEEFKFKVSNKYPYPYKDKLFNELEKLSPGSWAFKKDTIITADLDAIEKFFQKYLEQDDLLAIGKTHYSIQQLDLLQRLIITTLSEWLKISPIQWPRARLEFKEGKIGFYFSPELSFSTLEEFENYLEVRSLKLPRNIRKLLAKIQLRTFETSIEEIKANIKNWLYKQYSVENQRLVVKISLKQHLQRFNLPIDEYFYMAVIDDLKSLWRLFSKKLEFNIVDGKIVIYPKPLLCLDEEEIACFILPEAMQKELDGFLTPQKFERQIQAEELPRIEYIDEISYVAMRIATYRNFPGKLSTLEARLGRNLPGISLEPDFHSLGYRWLIKFEDEDYARFFKEELSAGGDGATLFLDYEQMHTLLSSLGIRPEKIKNFYAQFDFYSPSEVETKALLEDVDLKNVHMDAHMLRSVKKAFKELYTFFPFLDQAKETINFSSLFNSIKQRHNFTEIQQFSHRTVSPEAKLVLLNMIKLLSAESKAKRQESELSTVFNTIFSHAFKLAATYPSSMRVQMIASLLRDNQGEDNSIHGKLVRFRKGINASEIQRKESIFASVHTLFANLNMPLANMDLEIDYFLSASLTAIEKADRDIVTYRPR